MPEATLRNPGVRPDVITVGDDMGRVITKAYFENVLDAWEAKTGNPAHGGEHVLEGYGLKDHPL